MKNNFLFKLSLFAFLIIFAGIFNESTAQSKQSNPDVFFPSRKRTSPVTNGQNYPVWTKNQNNLPPGQAKKADGDRNDRFDKNRNKKWNKQDRNDKEQGDNGYGNKKWNKQDRKRNEQGDNDNDNKRWNKQDRKRNEHGNNEDRNRQEHQENEHHSNGHDD